MKDPLSLFLRIYVFTDSFTELVHAHKNIHRLAAASTYANTHIFAHSMLIPNIKHMHDFVLLTLDSSVISVCARISSYSGFCRHSTSLTKPFSVQLNESLFTPSLLAVSLKQYKYNHDNHYMKIGTWLQFLFQIGFLSLSFEYR